MQIATFGSTTAVEQIIGWSKEQFEEFLVSEDNQIYPRQQEVLERLKTALELEHMEEPYEYVKAVQAQYNSRESKIKYSGDYYDTLGLDRPDGTASEQEPVGFEPVFFSFTKKTNYK